MPLPDTQTLHSNFKISKWFIVVCLALLAIFPIYKNFYYSQAHLTYERHIAVMEKRSEFYNPWQYRVLMPFINEGLFWLYNHTVDKIYPIEQKISFTFNKTSGTVEQTDQFIKLMQTPGAARYMIIFIVVRLLLNFFILLLAWRLWRHFIKSDWLAFLGVNFIALAMGNAVAIADLAFNTYADIIFYLLTALIIVEKQNRLWLVPITILSSFNRETGLLIPALYFISQVDFSQCCTDRFSFKKIIWPKMNIWIFTAVLYLLFMTVFVFLRWYYGYQPQQMWKVPAGWPMLKLNLFSAVGIKGYLELIGTFGILPLIILYKFKTFPYLLKKWFLFLAPIWFLVHFISVPAYQTRLFLVPIIVIFMPMVLWLTENHIFSFDPKKLNV